MKFTLKLIESDNEIQTKIISELKNRLNKMLSKAKPIIVNQIKDLVKKNIINEPEYQSLISGQLKYELGVPNVSIVESIVDIWINNINLENKPIRSNTNSLVGGLTINMIKSDYSDVLSSQNANIIDANTGSVVPWLEWLLLRGGDILVKDYEVKFGPNPRSRTGMAIMVSSNRNYRIPPQFAGTPNNNWVYRAISKIDDSSIQKIIQNTLEKSI